MRTVALFTTIFVAVLFISTSATIINIPDDYPTIQAGIDASVDGDTVLVQPATYYENINFNGHNIVLGSLFLTTGDTTYISSTIIDGDSSGSVVTFENGEDSTAVIAGFTIQNGSAETGGGINCSNSGPVITKNIITGNIAVNWNGTTGGGGIYCWYSDPIIINNIIDENSAYVYEGFGGGIWLRYSNPTFNSNYIKNNSAFRGGGIAFDHSNPIISSNILIMNSGIINGGGIYCYQSGPTLINNTLISNIGGIYCSFSSPIMKNTILWNFGSEIQIGQYSNPSVLYCAVRGGWEGAGNIDSDPLFIDPYNDNCNVCSQSPCINAGDPELHDPDGTRSDIGVYFADHPECFAGSVWNVSTTGNDTTGNGSPEYPFRTVQHAIDISLHGDSILVENGTYIENINIYFKKIKLISNYVFSDNPSDIETTILDGDSLSTVSYIAFTDSLALIRGFTIRNGGESGVFCWYADPLISNNLIRDNGGGTYGNGGGIYCLYSEPQIIGNIIVDNHVVSSGGGIYCHYSNPVIINNTISGNSPSGIEIFLGYSSIISNSIIWANTPLELNVHGIHTIDITYSDIRGGYEGEGNIDANPLFVDPVSANYNICEQSPCIDAGNPDMQDPDGTRMDMGFFFSDHPECDLGGDRWYVSMSGNDSSGDGSQDNPFRTIQHAINVCFHSDTIIVENGVYEENIIVHDKSIVLASEYLYSGDWNDVLNTVIAGGANSSAVTLESCDSPSSFTGFTISNGYGQYGGGIFCNASNTSITNNIITQNTATYGGGICCFYSNSIISDNIISNNTASSSGNGIYCFGSPLQIANNHIYNNSGAVAGGGLSLGHSDALITNNKIFDNSVSVYGAGLECNESDALIINNTISGNTAGYYGGGLMTTYSSPYIVNTIFWGDSALIYPESNEIYVHVGNSPVIYYSDIEGGWEGEGNIDVDPLFRDPENGDFHLMSTECGDPYDSPCIDAGHPDILDSLLDCSWGLGELRSDMGAYGGGDSTMVGIDDEVPEIPNRFALAQNYPNPFNAVTVIPYSLPEPSDVKIEIYDILGRRVETLVNEEQQAGYHQVLWDAKDASSGMYFYRIQAGEYSDTKKMVLLK